MAIPFFNAAPKRALGLHIGPGQIRIVEIERGKEEPRIVNLAWEETPPEAYVGSRLENPSALANTLIRMLTTHQIKTKYALAAVDGSDVIARTIVLPNMPIKELRKAILFETEASLPTGTGDNVLDYAILRNFTDKDDKSEKVEVLILSAHKQPLGLLVESLLEAGLKPAALDLTPVAAHRAERRSPKILERGSEYILITINDRCTDLSIIFDSQVRLIRSIPIGATGFLDALGERFLFDAGLDSPTDRTRAAARDEDDLGIERHDEEEVQFGTFGEDPFSAELTERDEALAREGMEDRDELAKLNPIMTELVDETLNTIRYGQSFGKERAEIGFGVIDGYYPYGAHFVNSISEKLGMPVMAGDPLAGITIADSGIRDELVRYFAPDFSCAIGLGLRGVGQFE